MIALKNIIEDGKVIKVIDLGKRAMTISSEVSNSFGSRDAKKIFTVIKTLVPKLYLNKPEVSLKFLRKSESVVEVYPFIKLEDSRGFLHSMKEPAVRFGGGEELYYISGVRFDKETWSKLITDPSLLDLMKISNIEDRMRVLKVLSFKSFIDKKELTLLDKSDRGNELYSLDINKYLDIEEDSWRRLKDDLYVARYWCPSTNREYVSYISPEAFKNKNNPKANEAIAWKHHLSIEEYNKLTEES